MRRDMDLVRQLLMEIEDGKRSFDTTSARHAEILGLPGDDRPGQEEAAKLAHHLDLLEQRGLIEIQAKSLGGVILIKGLTWDGHEFLATVRDVEVWKQTKDLAKKGGTEALSAMWDIAKAVGKEQLKRRTGLEF